MVACFNTRNLFPVSTESCKTSNVKQVVYMMDELSGNNIPSVSNDDGQDNDETESDELDQLSTIYCTVSLIAWCAQ